MKKNIASHKKSNTPRKSSKPQIKNAIKLKTKKSYQNTASTLGSRSSMDSKLTRNRQNTHMSHNSMSMFGLTQQRRSIMAEQSLFLPLTQNNQVNSCPAEEGNISYRQYCMIGGRWIPLLTNTQRERTIFPLSSQSKKKENQNMLDENIHINVSKPQFTTTPNLDSIQKTLQKLKSQMIQDNSLQNISGQSKNYYCDILRTVMRKLQNSTGEVLTTAAHVQTKVGYQKESQAQSGQRDLQTAEDTDSQISPVKCFEFEKDEDESQSLAQVIRMRQIYQTGVLPFKFVKNTLKQRELSQIINTSVPCVQQYISKVAQTISQSNLGHQIVGHIKTAWGWTKKEKLSRMRANKHLGSMMDVLPDHLFELVEDTFGRDCVYEFIHNRCLFDYLNYELCKLKPFYDSDGETSPWNFKLSAPLTFFEVQQSSLGLALDEVKLRIMQSCNMLCGLIVDICPSNPQYHLLAKRRQERQDLMCRKYLLTEEHKHQEENAIEREATMLLLNVSELILQQLVMQFQPMQV